MVTQWHGDQIVSPQPHGPVTFSAAFVVVVDQGNEIGDRSPIHAQRWRRRCCHAQTANLTVQQWKCLWVHQRMFLAADGE